jgi:amidohydrolase
MLTDKIKSLVGKHYERGVRIRRHIHRYPELSGREEETAALVANTLREAGAEVRGGVAGHGVIGLINGNRPGRTVMLRADMDALEVNELADVPYRSERPGVMHACGHDGHTAGLLLAAMALCELKDDFPGTVKLMFQPAEETVGGALPMIEAGALDDPHVDAAFGCHLWGQTPEGVVRVKAGPLMASPDEFTITLKGTGGHGGAPHLTPDLIVLASELVLRFQTIISRLKDPLEPAVLSVCSIHGGEAFNVLPGELRMTGTIRTFSEEARNFIPGEMEKALETFCQAAGAAYSFEAKRLFPPLVNDRRAADIVRTAAGKIVGVRNVEEAEPSMGGEDFACIAERVPSAFFFVGIARDGQSVPHHSPYFRWDDRAIFTSACCLCQTALDFLLE